MGRLMWAIHMKRPRNGFVTRVRPSGFAPPYPAFR